MNNIEISIPKTPDRKRKFTEWRESMLKKFNDTIINLVTPTQRRLSNFDKEFNKLIQLADKDNQEANEEANSRKLNEETKHTKNYNNFI